MKLPSLLVPLATIPLLSASPTPHPHPSRKYPGLNTLARRAGLLYFGTAVDNPTLNNTRYVSIARSLSEFGQITPANGQKWMYIEPSQNEFNYTDADTIIQPAKRARQLARCHNFVWHNQLPSWLIDRNWTKPELVGILENHIKNEATHFYNECYAWDVVNEAFEDDGSWRKTLWYNTIGPSYIALAFEFARKYVAPGTKLYYNDYNIETVGNKSLAVAALVQDLQSQDVQIDGVGLQAHFVVGSSPSYNETRAAMNLFTELGVEVALTELDVRMELPDSEEKQAQQAVDYANAVRACKDTEACVGVTVWDFWDTASWVPYTFEGEGNADLWTANFTKKPAYYAVSDVLSK